jgi:hypothetical protein
MNRKDDFMKKMALIIVASLLGLFVSTSFACDKSTEITLFGPNKYLRTKGEPNVYTGLFPGIPGKGKLIVKNGDKDGDHRGRKGDKDDDHRLNRARILINGKQVLGSKDFNQKIYEIRVPVRLKENNSISIELRSEPGSYLTLRVVQEVAAEAAAVIGPEGGVVQILDNANPLFGCGIEVPAGVLSSLSILSISTENIPPAQPLPDGVMQDGPIISFNSTNPNLQGPVYLSLPFNGTRQANEARLVFTYNTNTGQWETIAPLPTPDPGVFRAILWHFSNYVKGKATITATDITASFKVGIDSLSFANDWHSPPHGAWCSSAPDGRVCAGLSWLTTEYFNLWPKYGKDSLMCHWSRTHAALASCEAFGIYNNYYNAWWRENFAGLTSPPPLDYSHTIDFIRHIADPAASNKVTPLLIFGTMPDPQNPGETKEVGHAVVAYGWTKIDDSSGRIKIYNVDNNESAEFIRYSNGSLLPYTSNGVTWTRFMIQPLDTLDVSTVFNDFPDDQLPEQMCSISAGPWLSFVEGNPGIPGDGVLTNASYGYWFMLAEPIPLKQFTDGFTITVFPLPSDIADFLNCGPTVVAMRNGMEICGCHPQWSGPWPTGNTIFGGNVGIYTSLPQSMVDLITEGFNTPPGCHCTDVTVNDVFLDGFILFRQSGGDISTLDAAAILPGQNAVP